MANAKLKAPKGMTSVSIDGQEIEVVRGYVSVPAELIAELIGHGFAGAQDETEVDPNLPAGVLNDLEVNGEVIDEKDEKEELGTAQDSDNEQAAE